MSLWFCTLPFKRKKWKCLAITFITSLLNY